VLARKLEGKTLALVVDELSEVSEDISVCEQFRDELAGLDDGEENFGGQAYHGSKMGLPQLPLTLALLRCG
jgi:hypothetical protein